MVRKIVSATVSAALCMLSITPAFAQDYRFAGFDAPRGATATVNLRVPMGGEQTEKASYGLTFGYGQTVGAPALDGRTMTRAVKFADFRFSGTELRQARVASFDLANLDKDRRFNDLVGPSSTLWTVGLVVGAGVLVCFVVTDCFGDDEDDDIE